MKKLLLATFAAGTLLTCSAKTLWQADFSKPGMPGFKLERMNPKDSVVTGNGEMVITCTNGMNKGISYSQDIPMPDRGELSFTAVMNEGLKPKYNGGSLQFILFGNMFTWNGVRTIGLALYAKPPVNKFLKIYKNIDNQKVNFRVRYDVKAGTMDFYVEDSWLPVKRFKDIKFRRNSDGTGKLVIANYGVAHGTLTHRISDLKLTTWEDDPAVREETVVWKEDFSRGTTMEANGYKLIRTNNKDAVTVKDGIVTFVCENSPGKGTFFEKEIPCPKRGEFSFEVKTNLLHSTAYTNCALSFYLDEMLITFRQQYCLQLFHLQKLKWNTISQKISWNTWHKVKVVFDADSPNVEFYVDDMEFPAFIDEQSEFIPKKKIRLKIYNWGEASGSIVNQFRNLQMKALPPVEEKIGNYELNGTMLVRGISSEGWDLDTLLSRLEDKGEVKSYLMNVHGPQLGNLSIVKSLEPKPVFRKILPKYIIIADAPATAFQTAILKGIYEAVQSGAKLILLGGLHSIEKGGYEKTPLKKLLPYTVTSVWQPAEPLSDAEVYMEDGRNAVISKSFGKGKVFVVPGNVFQNPEITNILSTFDFNK